MAKGNFIEYVVSDDPNKYPYDGEQDGYYYEKVVKNAATSIPTDLIPEIVCADNHLRDIVIEDGIAYARIGFYSTDITRALNLTVTQDLSVSKMVVIGPGGKGGIMMNDNMTGSAGGAGQKREIENFKILAGSLKINIDFTETKATYMDGYGVENIQKAAKGADGEDGGYGQSASPVEGANGYYLELMPQICRRYNGSDADLYTGAGIGAGGPGNEIADQNYAGILGGVFIYVKL